MPRKREDYRLSREMERYLEESVKRHHVWLSKNAEIVKKHYAPIVAKLRSHALSKRLGLDFEEPILSKRPTDMRSKADKAYHNIFSPFDIVTLPIILDESMWKCKPRIRSKDIGFIPHRIHLIDDDSQNGSVSMQVSREVVSRRDFVETFYSIARVVGLTEIPRTMDFELLITFGSQGLNIVTKVSTDTDCLFPGIINRVSGDGPCLVLKIKSQDAGDYVFAPMSRSDRAQQWCRSYKEEEIKLIEELDGKKEGIRYKVERTLEYASRSGSSSPLSILDPYVYTNAVLNTGQDPQWERNDLGFAFRKTLTYVEACLGRKVLSRYFEPEHNLLALVSQTDLNDLLRHLKTTREMKSYSTLLC